ADVRLVAWVDLLGGGFLVKAADVPFHLWLPDAHGQAPAAVCALFSGVMVCVGVHGVSRVWSTVYAGVLPASDVRRALLVLGCLTALIGAVRCFAQQHGKRMLAYSTI